MRVLTLNARGLNDNIKRQAIFNKFEHYDVCCVQEAFFESEKTVESWKLDWSGEILFQPGTTNSGGLLILINVNSNIKNISKIEVNERILGVSFLYSKKQFVIYNIYAPAAKEQRTPFFEQLPHLIKPFQISDHVIFCGDFNNLLNNDLDNIAGIPHGLKEINAFKHFTQNFQVTDSFRKLYPHSKQFTWSRISNNEDDSVTWSARRLDYIFLNSLAETYLVNTEIVYFSSTDHKAVICTLETDDYPRGRSLWKLNESLLGEKKFKKEMSDFITEYYNELLNDNLSSQDLWDVLKVGIRDKTIEYSRNKIIESINTNYNLEDKINEVTNQLILFPKDTNLIQKLVDLRRKKEIFDLAESNGAMKRAKLKLIDEWEKNSAYFLGLEKMQQSKHVIKEIYNKQNQCVNSPGKVLTEISEFYKYLMNNQQEDTVCNDHDDFLDSYLKDCDFPILNNTNKNSLENSIIQEDFDEALKLLNADSSPGSDGLSAIFYQTFWDQLKKPFFNCVLESFQKGSLTLSQRTSILTLLPKNPEADQRDISNYRPISLTNFDYRLISLVLAKKLQKVIKTVVHKSQTGFIENRSINDHIRMIDDVINKCNTDNLEGILVSLDFRKAFDTLSRASIISTLKKFNFGPNFIQYVATLLNNTYASVKNGGWLSESFITNRGIRQGCALSPLLFILVAEVLAIKIRNNKDIENISENFEKNLSYADDIELFLKSKKDLSVCLKDVDLFSSFSGLGLNRKKCLGMWLGKNKDNLPGGEGITWLEKGENLKILGIFFNSLVEASLNKKNWENKISCIQSLIDKWARRHLTLIGKSLVAKTFFLSQINNVIQSLALPPHVLNEIDDMVFKFLWLTDTNKNSREKLKRDTLCLDEYNGGISMISIKDQQNAFMCKWVTRIVSISPKSHFDIVNSLLKCVGGLGYILQCNISSDKFRGLSRVKSYYWRQAIVAWLNLNKEDFKFKKWEVKPCPTQIFNNKDICYKNQILFFPNWINKGILYSSDIIENGSFKSYEDIKNILEPNGNVFFQYLALKNALIHSKFYPNILVADQSINYAFDFSEIKNKAIRNSFLKKKDVVPQCLDTWKKKMNIDINPYFKVYLKATKESKLRALQYRILHHIYPTNKVLSKMKIKDNELCENCSEIETLGHLFFECQILFDFWKYVSDIISKIFEKTITINVRQALFGILYSEVNSSIDKINLANSIILIAKLSISKAKALASLNNVLIIFECERGLRYNNFPLEPD